MALLWTGVWENILDVERKWFFVGGGEREGGRTPTHHACETGMASITNYFTTTGPIFHSFCARPTSGRHIPHSSSALASMANCS